MNDAITLIGLVASIASLVLAVVAISLSIVFYRLSRDESEASSQNAQEISSGISRLEKIFDGLYSDTFAMMKDTVTDMREHIWRKDTGSVVSDLVDRDTGRISEPVMRKLEEFSVELGIADEKIEELREKMIPVVEESAENANTSTPELEEVVLRTLERAVRRGQIMTLRRLHDALGATGSHEERRTFHPTTIQVADAVFKLREQGKLTWEGSRNMLPGNAALELVRPDNVSKQAAAMDDDE